MPTSTALPLHEEVMLLALRDESGTIASGNSEYALAGALLAELLIEGRIRLVESRKKQLVELVSNESTGDDVLDDCLDRIAASGRRAAIATWAGRFAGSKRLRHRVALALCERGILRADEDTILLIFTRKVYPEIDPGPEREIIRRLRSAIFTNADDLDVRTVVLISLAERTGILPLVFPKRELRPAKRRIKQIINGELMGKAAGDALEAMQVTIFVAGIMPGIIITST